MEAPFNGMLPGSEYNRLAEIWVAEQHPGHEFTYMEFSEGTGITKGSVGRILRGMVKAGIIVRSESMTHKNRYTYRITWPITTTQGQVKETVVTPVRPPRIVKYSVTLWDGSKEVFTADDVEAESPQDAARKVREFLRAQVLQEWEF